MLNQIRNNKNSFFIKVIFIFVLLSFLGVGSLGIFVDLFFGSENNAAVIFSKHPNITKQEFLQNYNNELANIQRNNGNNLSQEQIENLNLNEIILKKMISQSMLQYLANIYDFSVSDDKITDLIHQSELFQNQDGVFDIEIYNQIFQSNRISPKEYFQHIKDSVIRNSLLEAFMKSYTPGKALLNNALLPMSDLITYNIFEINLTSKPQDFTPPQIAEEDMEDFYLKNQDKFTIPEYRKFSYIVTNAKTLKDKISFSEEELKAYFLENKEEFNSKTFAKAKNEVIDALTKNKMEELLFELAKDLEKDVANALTLNEIANKYDLKIQQASLSKEMMILNPENNIREIAETIFELSESEVSYPIESSSLDQLLIAELHSIIPERNQPYSEVKHIIKDNFDQQSIAEYNLNILNNLRKNYNSSMKIDNDNLAKQNIHSLLDKTIRRGEIPQEQNLPNKMLELMFYSAPGTSTKIVQADNKAYFAYIKNIKNDPNYANKIEENAKQHITLNMQESIMQELIQYLTEQNNIKITLQNN